MSCSALSALIARLRAARSPHRPCHSPLPRGRSSPSSHHEHAGGSSLRRFLEWRLCNGLSTLQQGYPWAGGAVLGPFLTQRWRKSSLSPERFFEFQAEFQDSLRGFLFAHLCSDLFPGSDWVFLPFAFH